MAQQGSVNPSCCETGIKTPSNAQIAVFEGVSVIFISTEPGTNACHSILFLLLTLAVESVIHGIIAVRDSLGRWKRLLTEVLSDKVQAPLSELAAAVKDWCGRDDPMSAAEHDCQQCQKNRNA